ncbi:FAD-binding oxidoreductase [Pelagicoccus albus]|uniref:FAD-binding oxidoreductase n=1 Tax=Pelagicoccus albus TaxID=415222 RepID=A0A7X1B9Q4_9BACT|nr:FAD-binding oxidoreductase [Pelagicoccus albus]MBC2607929.1 FAD-binding oxidoreductase [Pelagicoccus albus]
MSQLTPERLESLAQLVDLSRILQEDTDLEKYSKDFAYFSPLLKNELESKRADAVVLVPDLATLKALVSWCYSEQIPVTVRGGGTGNYGQCTPLYGGILLELMQLDKIIEIADGEATVEPGVRVIDLENKARESGLEMRCIPSTFVKSSIAGFICGGSGGIGSITYGGTANGGMVKRLKILTVEAEPKILTFEEDDCLPAINTYGTTGVVVELTLRMAPKRKYDQHIFAHSDFDALYNWCHEIANRSDLPKRLVSFFEGPISDTFKPLKKYLPQGHHSAFIQIDESKTPELLALAKEAGIQNCHFIAAVEPLRPPHITDYTWNHTMLWILKDHPHWTYLQVDYGEDPLNAAKKLKERFPEEIFSHFEWVKATSKWKAGEESVVPGGGPAINYTTKERLDEIVAYAEEVGCTTTSPHVYHLEEGYFEDLIKAKVELKRQTDPKGILNPGKMSSYPLNPFQTTSA